MHEMNRITVQTHVVAPIDTVWRYWNEPEHIVVWNTGSPDWHTPRAVNDLKVGGKFVVRMEAKDGSTGFDFEGAYTSVIPNERIAYRMDDGRMVEVTFEVTEGGVLVTETFDPEGTNSTELQKAGWEGILQNFKKHVEHS